jgi:hypothetical protein
MNYPVTRKELQDYDIEKKKDLTVRFYDSYPCHDFITHLNDRSCPRNQPGFEGDIQRVVEELCYDFPEHLYHTVYAKKYTFVPIYNSFWRIKVVDELGVVDPIQQKKKVIDAVISKLNEVFIDCDITTDKTNSYIFIQWA